MHDRQPPGPQRYRCTLQVSVDRYPDGCVPVDISISIDGELWSWFFSKAPTNMSNAHITALAGLGLARMSADVDPEDWYHELADAIGNQPPCSSGPFDEG